MYSGSWWIYKTAYGRSIAKSSWRSYCRKRKQFITALQFGSQIYSYASSYKNSSSKSSSGQGMGKLEKFPAWNLTKVQNCRHDVKCDVGEMQITGTLMERSVGCVDWCHKIHFFEWKATGWMFMVRAETDEKTNDLKGPTNYGPKCGNLCLTHQNVKRNKWAIEKPKLDNDRIIRVIYFIDPEDGKFKDIMNNVCQQQCLVKLHCTEVAGKPAALLEDTRQNTLVLLKLTNLWEFYWQELLADIMKITLQEKVRIPWVTTTQCANLCPSPQTMKIPDAKAAVEKE